MKATEQRQRPVRGPEKRVCANGKCRLPFVPSPNLGHRATRGLCPTCSAAIAAGNGWLVDKELWDECQRIKKAEPRFGTSGRGKRKKDGVASQADVYEAEQLAKLAKKPLRTPYMPSPRGDGSKKRPWRDWKAEGAE